MTKLPNLMQPDFCIPIPKENPVTFNTKNVFESTNLKPNGKRPRAVIYPKIWFMTDMYSRSDDGTNIVYKGAEDMGITSFMCGKTFEIVEGVMIGDVYLKEGLVVLIDSGSMGIVKRSIPAYAIQKIVSIETNPEYYV